MRLITAAVLAMAVLVGCSSGRIEKARELCGGDDAAVALWVQDGQHLIGDADVLATYCPNA